MHHTSTQSTFKDRKKIAKVLRPDSVRISKGGA